MADEADKAADYQEAMNQAALARMRVTALVSDGVCKLCKERIDADRMRVLPGTNYCRYCIQVYGC